MTASMAWQRCGRSLRRDRAAVRRLGGAVGFFAMLELGGPLGAQAGPPLTIVNDLPSSSVCAQGNTVSVFAPDQQVIQPGGSSLQVSGDFSSFPGVGIQVNNWYWTSISLPVQKGIRRTPTTPAASSPYPTSASCSVSRRGTGRAFRPT